MMHYHPQESYVNKYLLRKTLMKVFAVILLVFGASVGYSFYQIREGVKDISIEAKQRFGGDVRSALELLIQSEDFSFRQKNRAVWALGQFADPRALPFLEEIREEVSCTKPCPLDTHICRYELDKAIKWCRHGNATQWMYRNKHRWESNER